MKQSDARPRIVITGVGVVSPIGIGNDRFWDNLVGGNTGIGYLRSLPRQDLPSRLAAEVHDFDPAQYISNRKFVKLMSRDIQLGVAAATLAVRDAGISRGTVDPDRFGVDFGAGRMSSTPQELLEAVSRCSTEKGFDYTRWGEDAMGEVCPLWLLRQLPNMPACHVSIEHDARGPNNTITSREASALLALAEAVRVIQRDAADVMIVGGCGSAIHPVDITRMSLFEGLSRRDDDPQRACRPFDFERDGTIVGEGAAAWIVERYEHAVARGAEIYAEILGVGAGCDGRGYSNAAGGTGLVRAITAVLQQAGLQPGDIGHINAHGKSTQRDDLVEARAYHRVLGDRLPNIPVTAMKSYFGHSDAGSAALELSGTLLALRNGAVPRTLNYETPDPRCRVSVVHEGPHMLKSRTALTVNRTHLGQSAAAIVRAI
ncbi:MAG: beta-ketoacyl-[acyl-carrier-protein] synthase family protein [Planctomycetaceae bacterium]|nr:beta-ketoacyl-[acyl-carrier-protein] synthase family protein [Planctomycetaceae bacterium]